MSRLFNHFFVGINEQFSDIVVYSSSIALFIANLTAFAQKNIRRLLAFSGIAHSAFMLLIIFIKKDTTLESIFYYAITYALASLILLSIINSLHKKEDDFNLAIFKQLKNNTPVIISLTLALLSLAGIPPMAGFFAKFTVLAGLFDQGFNGAVIAALIASLIALAYYFKPIIIIFEKNENEQINSIPFSKQQQAFLIIASLILVLIGIFPNLFFTIIS